MTRRQNRMILVLLLVLGVFSAGYLGIKAFSENLLYFYTPTDIEAGKTPTGKSFRVGGLVKLESVVREDMSVTFVLTDNNKSIEVKYEGILPDLFREGQGIVATGSVVNSCKELICKNSFLATEVLAKHDENYMPPEVAEALQYTATLK
jgi:cytochrome c-type biogenesis protein CcmE